MLNAREIAYGTNGNSTKSRSSCLIVDVKIDVDRVWRRYDADNRCVSVRVLDRQERMVTAWYSVSMVANDYQLLISGLGLGIPTE